MAETQENAPPAPVARKPRTILGIPVGWRHVIVCNLIDMVMTGATFFSFGLFVRPLSAELGVGRAAINGGLLAIRVGAATSSPFLGYLVDRTPARWLVRAAGLAVGLSFVVIGSTSSVWLMATCLAVLVGSSVALMALATPVIAARWFTGQRGRAITLSSLGKALAGMVVLPLMAWLVGAYGWRTALIVSGMALFVVMWLLSLLIVEPPGTFDHVRSKRERQAGSQGSPDRESRWTTKQLLRNRDFWALNVAIAIFLGVDTAILATLIPYLQDRGFTLAQATFVITLKTAFAIGGKLVMAYFADKVDLRLLLGSVGMLSAVLCFTLSLDPSLTVLIAVSSVTSVAIGGGYPASNAVLAARFGVPSLGLAHGLMLPFGSAINGALLMCVGAAYDMNGDYRMAFYGLIVANLAGVGALMLVRPLRSSNPAPPPA
ncbi:MAG TPA: MFS transporter [Novosphingobium sp.]|nr:MFS transporter [Novosphingobium sp.]